MLCHILISIYGFIVMIDKPWLPWYLAGEHNIKMLCFDYPFTWVDPELYTFILVALGQPI